MRVGIISLWWPPHFGGGEIYAYRLARELRRAGIGIDVITSSPAVADRDNGDIDALRTGVFHEPRSMSAFRHYLRGPEHAAWCENAARWAEERRFTHILCNSPLLRPGFSAATPSLFARLRATGALVGAIHLDLGPRTVSRIAACYRACRDWERTATLVRDEQRAKTRSCGARAFYDAEASPLFYEPSFVLSCSHWSVRFIDPLDEVPKFVLHPLLPPPPSAATTGTEKFETVTVGMINPLPQKGALNMAHVIRLNKRNWTFRLLQGAWGQSFESFAPMIGDALIQDRVTLMEFAREMSAFYRASEVFMFPSLVEGYGMAPVEAMQAGTPVVATDYPPIREAVGGGARLVDYLAEGDEWIGAIADVLTRRDLWRGRAVARVRELQAREAAELPALIAFLQSMPRATGSNRVSA